MSAVEHDAVELLGRLVGVWDLSGEMGETPLRQRIEARWTLGGLFVEMRCVSTLEPEAGGRPYEALYHFGYNVAEDRYVMHLLDTFGVATSCVVGIGRREGDAVSFVFAYDDGPWTNTFSWDGSAGTWTSEITYPRDGERRIFATKRLTPFRP